LLIKNINSFSNSTEGKKMTPMMFNRAEYIRELRTSGLSQEQAETISRGVEKIRDDMYQLTTKKGTQENIFDHWLVYPTVLTIAPIFIIVTSLVMMHR
jgi:hypothetical protein